jgi:hypothetical protein
MLTTVPPGLSQFVVGVPGTSNIVTPALQVRATIIIPTVSPIIHFDFIRPLSYDKG